MPPLISGRERGCHRVLTGRINNQRINNYMKSFRKSLCIRFGGGEYVNMHPSILMITHLTRLVFFIRNSTDYFWKLLRFPRNWRKNSALLSQQFVCNPLTRVSSWSGKWKSLIFCPYDRGGNLSVHFATPGQWWMEDSSLPPSSFLPSFHRLDSSAVSCVFT